MGWTGCVIKKGTKLDNFFDKEFTCKFIGKGSLFHLSEYYRPFVQKDGKYNVMVCLVHYRPKEDFNFAFKSMSADMGPFYFNCPEYIIDMVKDNFSENEEAQKWLNKCQKRNQKKKENKQMMKNLKHGDVIEFSDGFVFSDGKEYNTFVCFNSKHKKILRAYKDNQIGYPVKLKGWKNLDFKIIGSII